MEFRASRLDNKVIGISKITVFLGANGVGKSSILRDIKSQIEQILPGKKVVYIEGGRTINLKNSLKLDPKNVNRFQDFEQAKTTYENKRQNSLSDRVYDALMMLERKELAIKAEHSDAVDKWHLSGQEGSCPTREKPPLERLFDLFHEVFPRLRIKYNPHTKNIQAQKGDATYSVSNMSDGEKQAFSILADFVELGDEYGVIVVDEPELNLHSELAERIWNLIESEFPDKTYCYATHNLSFAMRAHVEKIVVLSEDPDNVTEIEDVSDIPPVQLNEFLGSIPGIISAEKVVVTEGTEKSFDSIFYRWILANDQIEVLPAGGCEQVVNVCQRNGVWQKIAPKVSLVGVIDKDFRDTHAGSEVQLQLHEAESYLAIPSLVVAADSILCIMDQRVAEDDIIKCIMDVLDAERHLIYANSVASNCGIRLGVSVRRKTLRDCSNTEELIANLRKSSQEELRKAAESMSDDAITSIVTDLEASINDIIAARDWKKALEIIDGKRIANQIAQMIGVRNSTDLMRSVSSNIEYSDIAEVRELSEKILSELSVSQASNLEVVA